MVRRGDARAHPIGHDVRTVGVARARDARVELPRRGPATLPGVVDGALRDVGRLDVRLGRMAWFGDREDVPVLFVASAGVERAHERLARALVTLPGFAADTPRHWRAGYRPHLTLGRAVSMPSGTEAAVACVAIARLDPATAVVEAVLSPPAARRPSA